MEHQRNLAHYGSGVNPDIESIVDDLERILRKDGFSGERAYRVLCDLLIVKSYFERQDQQKVVPNLDGDDLYESINQILQNETNLNGTSEFVGDLSDLSETRLRMALDVIDGLSLSHIDIDVFGFFYGKFFSDVFRGESGKFFTPRQVVSAMVELAGPRSDEIICDPACGSGGFLVWASKKLEGGNYNILGNDHDSILADTARANLYIMGEERFQINKSDLFDGGYIQEHESTVDLILANPPFSIEYSTDNVWAGFDEFTDREKVISDYLFLESAQHLLKPGGRLVSLFPLSMISNSDHERFRDSLRSHWSELACITLPEGVFYPYSGTSAQACILMLVRDDDGPYYKRPTLKANINQIGYDTSRKKYTPIDQNDFNDLFSSDEYGRFLDIRDEVIEK